ncbi:MAG: GNAT family N-acetyltransferase [Bacteroidota bacterium]
MPNSPNLVTERLRLRCPVQADFELFYQLHSDPEVMRYITNGVPHDRETVQGYVGTLLGKLATGNPLYNWWMAERQADGAFVGWFILKDLDNTEELEIGYRLMTQHWGQGYATEGSRAILNYAFNHLQLERIVAVALPENKGSRRVIEKLGMSYRKEARFYGKSCVYYDLTKKAYENLQ